MMSEAPDGQNRNKKKQRLPPPSTTPQQLLGMQIESYHVGSWCPSPDGTGPAEAVAIGLKIKGLPHELILRLKSPERVDELIQLLLRHKRDVWPDSH